MAEKTPTFREYVEGVKEVLKTEIGEEFIQELTNDWDIDNTKSYTAITDDTDDYSDAIIIELWEDLNGTINLSVGKAFVDAGIYEFSDIQVRIQNVMAEAKFRAKKLREQHLFKTIAYPVPAQAVVIEPSIDVLDYGILYTDDVGNRWSMFLPYISATFKFQERPSVYAVKETLRQAIQEIPLSLLFGWVADEFYREISKLSSLVRDSWEKYQKLQEDYEDDTKE